jgi:hypothetical protein
MHRKKKVREFPVPRRDVTTKLSLGGNNVVITELFLPRGSLVSDIPAGDGKLVNLFLQCVPKCEIFDRSDFPDFYTSHTWAPLSLYKLCAELSKAYTQYERNHGAELS